MSATTDPKVAVILAQLSPRLREVLDLVGEGLPNKLIGRRLDITEMTVKIHVKSLLRAFGVGNRTQLALLVRGAAVHEEPDLRARLAAAEARAARAEAALQPFADFASYVARERRGWDHDGFLIKGNADWSLHMAPFRTARAVLAAARPSSPTTGGGA